MKKGVVVFSIFTLVLLVLLSSGIFAVDYVPEGECKIVQRSQCADAGIGNLGDHIIFGLSASTNSHAQSNAPTYNDYSYVLCCHMGIGNKTCTTSPSNKVIGLSSFTNAHAEAPSQTNYPTINNVCYDDFRCEKSSSTCPEGYLGIISLSSDTNAHVGNFTDFSTRICCGGTTIRALSCTIKSAKWNLAEAIENQGVRLEITGSGLECDTQAVSFEVREADTGSSSPVTTNPVTVGFTGDKAIGLWYAEYQDDGPLQGDPEYYFNSTIVGSPKRSMLSADPKLVVKQVNLAEECASVTICGDYIDRGRCESDASLCNVSKDSSLQGVDCSSAGTSCACVWNTAKSKCDFSYTEIKSGLCGNGFTLCHSPSGINYCYAGAACPSGQSAASDGVAGCGTDDSCASSECKDNDQASCASGTKCSGGKCYSASLPVSSPRCGYGFTLCREPVAGVNYCYPGTTCLTGNEPTQDNDGKCEVGEGCLVKLNADCKDGDQDTCSNETYCSLGKCSSVQSPIVLGVLGGCKITQTIDKTCEQEPAGYKIIGWDGEWTGTIDPSNPAYQRCIAGGSSTVPCPAQVQLPFFDYYEIAITVAVIALVYLSLVFKRKLKRKRK